MTLPTIVVVANIPNNTLIVGASNDKLQHIIAFAILSSLAALGFPKLPLTRLLAVLVIINILLEAGQGLLSLGRQPDPVDFVFGVLATVLVLATVAVWRARCVGMSKP